MMLLADLPIWMSAIGSLTAALAAVAACVLSARNHKKIEDIHVQINSRMDALIQLTQKSSFAEGRLSKTDPEGRT